MKKIVIHSPGNYDQLKIEEAPDLMPKDDEILVEIKATGINYADIIIRWGLYESAKQFVGWPITPGFEFSGFVKSVGAKITSFKSGEKVFGVSLFNAYASQICVKEHQLYALPEKMSFEEGAAFPAVFMTAYHALFQNVVTRPGMKALIHSAAGGVGSSLVQLCRIANIKTVGVVGSSHKVDFLKSLGCDLVIDKSHEDLWKEAKKFAPEGFDLIFDANGGVSLKEGYIHLRSTGKLISYGAHTMFPKTGGKVNWIKLVLDYLKTPRFNPIHMTSENKSLITFNLSFLFERKDLLEEAMGDLIRWYQEDKIKVSKVQTFPFEKVGEAHRALESGQTTGKLVLVL
jgi:NADPH:quinone reductase-like Zn-dependent oxidoreductase